MFSPLNTTGSFFVFFFLRVKSFFFLHNTMTIMIYVFQIRNRPKPLLHSEKNPEKDCFMIFFLFSQETMLSHFKQVVSICMKCQSLFSGKIKERKLHEFSKRIFWENDKLLSVCHMLD